MARILPPTTAATGNTNTNTLMQSQSQNIEVFAAARRSKVWIFKGDVLRDDRRSNISTIDLDVYMRGEDTSLLLYLLCKDVVDNHYRCLLMLPEVLGMVVSQECISFE
jgi:hypothetical protein